MTINKEPYTLFMNNHYAVTVNLEGISHEDSLISPKTGGNCINWILGHILYNRDFALKVAGQELICDERFRHLYSTGSKLSETEKAVGLNELINKFNRSQELLIKGLSENDLKEDEEKIEYLIGLGFHEAYHAGQLGILRRILGKPGKIG